MIRQVHLYLFRQLVQAFLIACVAVCFIVLFTQSFRLLSFVLDNNGSLSVFLRLMGLMLPSFLPLVLPISAGLAVLFIYHKVSVDSELVVLRAAGLSPLRLALPAFALALFVMGAHVALALWVAPTASRALSSLHAQVRDSYSSTMIRPGVFNDLAEGLTFYAKKKVGGALEELLVHDVRQPERPVTVMARRGLFSLEKGQPQVVVFEGLRQEVDLATGRLQQLDFDRYVLDLQGLSRERGLRPPEPREMSVVSLWSALSQKEAKSGERAKMEAELHQRLASPFLSVAFALIGATIILTGEFNRRGLARRVLFAATLLVAAQAATLGLVSQISKAPWATPLLYLIVCLPVPICGAFLQGTLPQRVIERLKKGTT